MSFHNMPERPFMTSVHGRVPTLVTFLTLDEARADAASFWVSGDVSQPSSPVKVHGYNEVWGEWNELHVIEPGSISLPWPVAAVAVIEPQSREEAVAQARTQALAPVLELHQPYTDFEGTVYCKVCFTQKGDDGDDGVLWPCPTAIACGITAA